MSDHELATSTLLPAAPPPAQRSFLPSLFAILTGVILLSLTGLAERHWQQDHPWRFALMVTEGNFAGTPETAADVIDIHVRHVPSPPGFATTLLASLQEMAEKDGMSVRLGRGPALVALDLPVASLEPLLVSGRLPVAGESEVLAGDLAPDAPFELDGARFKVVGRLHPNVPGFLYAYALPLAPGVAAFFSENAGATKGWLHPEGQQHIENLFPKLEDEEKAEESGKDEKEEKSPVLFSGQTRTQPRLSYLTLFGLVVVAVGSSWLHTRLFFRLSHANYRLFGPLFREMRDRPLLFAGMHVFLYGTFFGWMAAGLESPLVNFRLTEYVGSIFTEGGLSYIGEAYASQNILRATFATWFNNYVVQSLGLTYGISLIPIALGVLKTAFSFALVGFAMAPLWIGTAAGYAFHCITMALELEAYIVACFVVTVWPLRWIQALFGSNPGENAWLNVRIYAGGALLTGIMLALAALYEATTLILFG